MDNKNAKGLADDLVQWVGQVASSPVSDFHRLAKVRREAWQVTCEDGSRYFLRIERGYGKGQRHSRDLKRETGLIRYLSENTAIKTQRIVGWNEQHGVALQSMEPGSGDLHKADAETRHAAMMDFMDQLAALHRLDASALSLEDFEWPQTPEDHSLLEVEATSRTLPPVSKKTAGPEDLLARFSVRFLERHAPAKVQRTVLLQGDTGAGNFMFDGKRVSAIVDWELAHYGDPMEDLGNMVARDFFQPSVDGDLAPYFAAYAEKAGVSLDIKAVTYYLVHQMSRSVLSLAAVTQYPDWQSNISLNIAYTGVCCRLLCQAMGQYLRHPEPAPEPLADTVLEGDRLHTALSRQQTETVTSAIEDPFAAYTAKSLADMMALLGREKAAAPLLDKAELNRISVLAGRDMASLSEARQWLYAAMDELDDNREKAFLDHFWWWSEQRMQVLGDLAAPWRDCALAFYGAE